MADEETDVISPEREMTAAEVLEEQKRLEDEALRLALPRQEAEAAALQADYRSGIGAGILARPTTPVAYAQGTVMPTSSGFMYVGNAVPPPDAGTPLAVQRAYESAVMRQNAPEAATAAAAVEAAGLPRPTGLSLPRPAPYPTPDTTAGMRYAPQQVLMDMVATGKIQGDEAKSLLQGLSMTAGNRAALGLTPAQQMHYTLQRERLEADKAKQEAVSARFVPDAIKQQYRMLLGQEAAAMTGGDAASANRARFAREALEQQVPALTGGRAVPAAAPTAPAPVTPVVEPPAAAPKKITSKADFNALPPGSIYIGKDGKKYRKP